MAIATNITQGTITFAGDLQGTFDVPELSSTGVIPGEYLGASLVVDSKGRTIYIRSMTTVDVPCATVSECGVVAIGENITDEGLGLISLPLATTISKGVIKISDDFTITGCVLDLPFPIATETTIGEVIVPTTGNLTVSLSGVLDIPDATDTIKGVLSVNTGNGLTITNNVIDFNPAAIPIATDTIKGTVIVPTSGNLDVDVSGNISVPIASDSVLGIMRVDNSTIFIDGSGILTSPSGSIATDTTLGTVIVPTSGNLDVDVSGNISVPTVSDSVLGVVQTSGYISSDVNGLIDLTNLVSNITLSNLWTKSQNTLINSLTFNTTIIPNFELSNSFVLTLTGATNFGLPINFSIGQSCIIIIKQDATGSRLATFDAGYKFIGSSVLSTIANSVDLLTVTCISSTEFLSQLTLDYK